MSHSTRLAVLAMVLGIGAADGGEPAEPLDAHKPVRVAARLQAKRGGAGVHALARVFDGPWGDGRNGAKGVVVNSGLQWSRVGTRWSFSYVRSGSAYGLQVIHPFQKGQVIIHIRQSGVGASTPRAWTQVGYGGGDARRLAFTDAFKEEFPLKVDEAASFTSTLRPDGTYELTANGRLVALGKFKVASPLSFVIKKGARFPGASGWAKLEFKGNEFPEQWEPGYAGILLEPLDGGQNTVTALRFAPSLARLKTDKTTDF